MSNATEIYNKLVSDNRLDSGWAHFLREKAKKADFNFEKAKGWVAVGMAWKSAGGYTADNLNFPGTFEGLSRLGAAVYQGGHGREVAQKDNGAITEHSGAGFFIHQADDPEVVFGAIAPYISLGMSIEEVKRTVIMTAAKPNEGAEASSQKRQGSTQRYGIGIVKTSNTLNKELKTLAAGLSARGYNNLSSEILKLSELEVTRGRNAAAHVARVLVSNNNLDAGWATFLQGKAAAGKLDWGKILGWIAMGMIWKAAGGWTQGGLTFPGTFQGLSEAGMAWSGSKEGNRVRETGGGFALEGSDDPKPILEYLIKLPGMDDVSGYAQAQAAVDTLGVNEGMLKVDIQGRQQAGRQEAIRPEEQEPVARQEGGQGETGEGRGSSGEGRGEGRVDWTNVQRKLHQMGGARVDGNRLKDDSHWGDNTAHAWGQVTDGAARPSNPNSAMETLEEIEEEREREQERTARQAPIDRQLLAAYVMYDEDKLSLASRDGLLDSAGLTVADSYEKAQDLIDDITRDRVTELYNTDKAAYGAADGNDERNFRIILTGFLRRKLAEDDSSDSGSTEISLRDYYNPGGTNIFMRKTDGTLFYGMRNGDRDVLYPIENRTQTRGGGPDYLNLREQRKMLREVRREHARGSDRYRAYQDIIQGQRKFETGERNIFDPSGRGERGEGQREEGRDALRDTSDSGRTRKQRRQERRQQRRQRRSDRRG